MTETNQEMIRVFLLDDHEVVRAGLREMLEATGDYVVVGDLEGYLHWMDRETGEFVHRLRLDKGRILVPCRSYGDILLAFSASGMLTAYKLAGTVSAEPSDES